jgi:Domain of unknown function (DUF6265)
MAERLSTVGLFIALILVADSGIIPAFASSGCTVSDLVFMQGEWHSNDGAAIGEERWVPTPANTLAGSSWVVKGTAVSFVEALSIAPQNGRIEMHLRHFDGSLSRAWEDKESPMVFVLAQCDGQSAVFDGTGDKLGEHITYRKTPEGLAFVGDFLPGGKRFRVEIKMHKAN